MPAQKMGVRVILCCCGCLPTPADVTAYVNVTKVQDFHTVPDPSGLNPYGRLWYQVDTTCTPYGDVPDNPVIYQFGFDRVDLDNPLRDLSGVLACAGTTIDDNCYVASGTRSFVTPCTYGWKAASALAVWPGRYGFVASGQPCFPDSGGSKTKVQSKSRRITAVVSGTEDETGWVWTPDFEHNYVNHGILDWLQTATVDTNGNLSRSGHRRFNKTQTIDGVDDGGSVAEACAINRLAWGLGVFYYCTGQTLLTGSVSLACESLLDGGCGLMSFDIYTAQTAEALTALNLWDPGPDGTTLIRDDEYGWEQRIITANRGTFSISDGVLSLTISGTVHNEKKAWAGGKTPPDGDGVLTYHSIVDSAWSYTQTITLTIPLAYSTIYANAVALLATWDLADDRRYPWRNDAKTWLMPYVTADAAATVPYIDWTIDDFGTCLFRQSGGFTGAVKGAPLPVGYGRHFDFRHITWGKYWDGFACGACQKFIGSTSPSELPETATAWTNELEGASGYGPGGVVASAMDYNVGSSAVGIVPIDGCFVQKWAETLQEWPSHNFARGANGCGHDRYLRNENDVSCITDWTFPDLVLATAPTPAYAPGNLIGLPDGIYPVASVTNPTTYVMGVKVADLPAAVVFDDAAKLRFPGARAICGTLAVVSATQAAPAAPVIVTVDRNHWLWNNDSVDFTGVPGLGAGLTPTVIDDLSFSIPFAGTLAAYTAGGTVKSSDLAISAAWDTTCPTHSYITREWRSQYREAQEDVIPPYTAPFSQTDTQESFTVSARSPMVVCVSPNGEVFPRGRVWGFTAVGADQCYGEIWRRDFLQAVVDPMWQAPHAPCGHIGSWTQADAPCTETAAQYPYPPLIEARKTLPSGAPALPTGLTIYPGAELAGAVTSGSCADGIEPLARPTMHNIRAAWEACTDWQVEANANCPT